MAYHSLTKKVEVIEKKNNFLEKKIEEFREQKNMVEAKSESKNSLEASRSSPHISTTILSASSYETASIYAEQSVLNPAYYSDFIHYEKPSSMMYEKAMEEKLAESDRKMTSALEQNASDAKAIENQLFQHENQLSQHEKILKICLSELEQLSTIACSTNGEYLWRISELNANRNSQSVYINSPPFYTGRNGYKMSIRASFNGYDNGNHKHLSIYFVLMKGEYDPLLQWPFRSTVSLILIDQDNRNNDYIKTFEPDPRSCSFQKPKTEMNVASGFAEFADLSVLENKSYVKDDVMYIKTVVHMNASTVYYP